MASPALDAFDALYERHSADVFRAANDVLHDATLAEEVVQDVFLAFWRGTAYDESRGPVGSYLRLLARSRALDTWRRARTRERTATRVQARTVEVAADTTQEAVLHGAERELARTAVRRLPPDQRHVIALTYWGDMTVQEAAEAQGIPLGTAKSRVRLALGKLAADPAMAAA
jgi:RNA polymerase sigma-70 factor (ECF subfamily)